MNTTKKKQGRRTRKQIRKQIGRHFASRCPEVWDEDKTLAKEELYLDAATYKVQPIFDLPAAGADMGTNYMVSPQGSFAYQNRLVPKYWPLKLLEPQNGFVVFNRDVTIPTLFGLDRRHGDGRHFESGTPVQKRVRQGYAWMSLTPMEMLTQRSGVEAAKGTVVIGGLGLGWLLRKVCDKDSVERVIVVDNSEELLDWYGIDLCGQHEKVTDVICDDIYKHIGRHGDDAVHLLDIWQTYMGANLDWRLQRAKREFGERVWAWGWNDLAARACDFAWGNNLATKIPAMGL